MTPCNWGFHKWGKWRRMKWVVTTGKDKGAIIDAQERVCARCGKIEVEPL